jgi:hypothetical protein
MYDTHTPPKDSEKTLSLNPTTETGVKRLVVVPSPSCKPENIVSAIILTNFSLLPTPNQTKT